MAPEAGSRLRGVSPVTIAPLAFRACERAVIRSNRQRFMPAIDESENCLLLDLDLNDMVCAVTEIDAKTPRAL